MQNENPSPSTGAAGKSCSSSPYMPDPKQFDTLCQVCEAMFSRIREDRRTFSWFHSITELIVSAAKGCHFCNTLVAGMGLDNNPLQLQEQSVQIRDGSSMNTHVVTTEALKVETRCIADFGVALFLRCSEALDHEVLTKVDLWFEDTPDKTRLHTLSEDTESDSALNQVLQWNENCLSNHFACKPNSAAISKCDYPARLVRVGKATSTNVSLCETSTMVDLEAYMTLSHCWGSHIPLRLLNENYSSVVEGIELTSLPKTFRDAVTMTRKLGISFLWIDSLCIIQDSDKDWEIESSKMGRIYKNSWLNLAAAAANDSTEGLFFHRSPLQVMPCRITAGRTSNTRPMKSTYTVKRAGSKQMVLYTRAWVFQEWLLAPRTLIFGKKELLWECAELNASEICPEGYPELDQVLSDEIHSPAALRKNWRTFSTKHSNELSELLELWYLIVHEYSKLSLTRFTDKLVAVSGLAAEVGQRWERMSYLAGIWSLGLRHGLLWRCINSGRVISRPMNAMPSWSWASVDRPVHIASQKNCTDALVKILAASVQQAVPSMQYGAAISGQIRIKGPMLKVKIHNLRRRFKEWEILLADDFENDTGSSESDDMENMSSALRFKIEAKIYWDDPTFQELIDIASVYIVPFETSVTVTGLCLEGLILCPMHTDKGHFRRLGLFQINDSGDIHHQEKKKLSPVGDHEHSYPDSTPEEIEILDGCSQVPPKLSDGRLLHRTILELKHMLSYIKATSAEESGGTAYVQDILERREHPGKMTSQKTISQTQQSEDDPYCNGRISTNLFRRYGEDIHRYPNINSLLSLIYVHNTMDEEENILNMNLYEERHGDGYFTFHIV